MAVKALPLKDTSFENEICEIHESIKSVIQTSYDIIKAHGARKRQIQFTHIPPGGSPHPTFLPQLSKGYVNASARFFLTILFISNRFYRYAIYKMNNCVQNKESIIYDECKRKGYVSDEVILLSGRNIKKAGINPAFLKIIKNYFLKVISAICVSTPFDI